MPVAAPHQLPVARRGHVARRRWMAYVPSIAVSFQVLQIILLLFILYQLTVGMDKAITNAVVNHVKPLNTTLSTTFHVTDGIKSTISIDTQALVPADYYDVLDDRSSATPFKDSFNASLTMVYDILDTAVTRIGDISFTNVSELGYRIHHGLVGPAIGAMYRQCKHTVYTVMLELVTTLWYALVATMCYAMALRVYRFVRAFLVNTNA